jgi:hypothetical protein
VTLQRAKSGPEQEGYEITLTKEWLVRLAPVIKIGLFVTQLALASFGVILPVLSMPQIQTSSIDAISALLDVCLTHQTSIIDDILSRSRTMADLQKQLHSNKQFLRTAEVGFREIYHLLYSLEVNSHEKFPGNWTPKHTGLILVHSPYDGSSEWVHESAVSQYKTQGVFSTHQVDLSPQMLTNRAMLASSPPSPIEQEENHSTVPQPIANETLQVPKQVHWDANLVSTAQDQMPEPKGCCLLL